MHFKEARTLAACTTVEFFRQGLSRTTLQSCRGGRLVSSAVPRIARSERCRRSYRPPAPSTSVHPLPGCRGLRLPWQSLNCWTPAGCEERTTQRMHKLLEKPACCRHISTPPPVSQQGTTLFYWWRNDCKDARPEEQMMPYKDMNSNLQASQGTQSVALHTCPTARQVIATIQLLLMNTASPSPGHRSRELPPTPHP